MGVDDEYKMVSADEANDHLLEREGPISRSAYKKRSLAASIAIGAVIGAAVMFLFSLLFAPQGYNINKSTSAVTEKPAEAEHEVTVVTTTVTAAGSVATVTQVASTNTQGGYVSQHDVDEYHRVPGGTILDCGQTVDEARAKGCVFDVMMQDWMPAPCYDETLSERYLAKGNWSWYADQEGTKELSLEQMRKGEHPVIFVIQDYHKSHCIYAWEKMVRAIRNDWPLIEELISYDHVMHCRHSTLSKEAEGIRGVRAPTAWPKCALYKDWQGHFPGNSASSVEKRSPLGSRFEYVDMPRR